MSHCEIGDLTRRDHAAVRQSELAPFALDGLFASATLDAYRETLVSFDDVCETELAPLEVSREPQAP